MKDAFESIIENALSDEVHTEHLLLRSVKVGETVLKIHYRRNDSIRSVIKQIKQEHPEIQQIQRFKFMSTEEFVVLSIQYHVYH